MKAIKINKTGGPEVLEIKEITLDEPGPEQVTIEHKAIGLNYIDTYHRSGLYPLKLPIGLGLEGAGVVTKVGEKVKEFKVGELKDIKKNDIIYWKGHVAVALSGKKLIHAYGPMKKTVIMDINQTIKRIKQTAKLKVIGIKRL